MARFWFEMLVQSPIIVLLWLVVARDAASVRRRIGPAPQNISPFAWGALAGLTWVGVVPYVIARRRSLRGPAARPADDERNLSQLWLWLSVGAAAWTLGNVSDKDWNNGVQHAILTAALLVTAALARRRDHSATVVPLLH